MRIRGVFWNFYYKICVLHLLSRFKSALTHLGKPEFFYLHFLENSISKENQ